MDCLFFKIIHVICRQVSDMMMLGAVGKEALAVGGEASRDHSSSIYYMMIMFSGYICIHILTSDYAALIFVILQHLEMHFTTCCGISTKEF